MNVSVQPVNANVNVNDVGAKMAFIQMQMLNARRPAWPVYSVSSGNYCYLVHFPMYAGSRTFTPPTQYPLIDNYRSAIRTHPELNVNMDGYGYLTGFPMTRLVMFGISCALACNPANHVAGE